jgi:Cu2+-exporting ATPase/Cu+-exporting ATPase
MNNTKTYRVKGMHCASCASIIEKTFKKTDGVHLAEVNYGTETAKIAFDESKTNPHHLSQKIEPLGYSLALDQGLNHSHGSQSAEEMGMSADEHAAHLGLNQSKKEKLVEVADMRVKVLSAILWAASTRSISSRVPWRSAEESFRCWSALKARRVAR